VVGATRAEEEERAAGSAPWSCNSAALPRARRWAAGGGFVGNSFYCNVERLPPLAPRACHRRGPRRKQPAGGRLHHGRRSSSQADALIEWEMACQKRLKREQGQP
jgi:hypothetical protein